MKTWQKIIGVIALAGFAFVLVWFLLGNASAYVICTFGQRDQYSTFVTLSEAERGCRYKLTWPLGG